MDAYLPEEKKKNSNQVTFLTIGVLAVLLLAQFIYFNNQLKQAREEIKSAKQARLREEKSAFPFNSFTGPQGAGNQSPNPYGAAFPQLFEEDPFQNFEKLHSRLYNMMSTARAYAPIVMQQLQENMASDFMPAVDITEDENNYLVRADIPGLEKDKIHITTKDNILSIRGVRENSSERRDDASGFYSVERSYGTFARNIPLPGPVDESNIKASYQDGVLTVSLPKEKRAESESRKIAVQ